MVIAGERFSQENKVEVVKTPCGLHTYLQRVEWRFEYQAALGKLAVDLSDQALPTYLLWVGYTPF